MKCRVSPLYSALSLLKMFVDVMLNAHLHEGPVAFAQREAEAAGTQGPDVILQPTMATQRAARAVTTDPWLFARCHDPQQPTPVIMQGSVERTVLVAGMMYPTFHGMYQLLTDAYQQHVLVTSVTSLRKSGTVTYNCRRFGRGSVVSWRAHDHDAFGVIRGVFQVCAIKGPAGGQNCQMCRSSRGCCHYVDPAGPESIESCVQVVPLPLNASVRLFETVVDNQANAPGAVVPTVLRRLADKAEAKNLAPGVIPRWLRMSSITGSFVRIPRFAGSESKPTDEDFLFELFK